MTVAELHGKLSASGSNVHDRLEDLLTSDIFGNARYLPGVLAIWDLLRTARRATIDNGLLEMGETLEAFASGDVVHSTMHYDVRFWPQLTRSEPDVLATWAHATGRFLSAIEVKWASDKSGDGVVEDDAGVVVSDQLAREYADLRDLLKVNDHGALVYSQLTCAPRTKTCATLWW